MEKWMELTPGKIKGLEALSDNRGVIAAAAMDQRGSLKKSLTAAGDHEATQEDLEQFKIAVTEVLTQHASAILLDPEYGLPAAAKRAPSAGLLLAYEESGYDNSQPGRLPDLLPHESVYRLKEQGADAVKVLLYYTKDEQQDVNDRKFAFLQRVGAECRALDIPFFLEPLAYDAAGGDEKGLEFARRKPEIVTDYMREFSKPEYGVDILKVEVPINMKFVEGTKSFGGGEVAYSREQAMNLFRTAAAVAGKPFIYLSAGVSNDQFIETLQLAAEANVPFNGVLCGRATWADGIEIFAAQGCDAFRDWLNTQGVKNIEAVNSCLHAAKPWYSFYHVQSPEALNPRAMTHV